MAYTPLPRDYAPDLGNGVAPAQPNDQIHAPSPSLFAADEEGQQPELDTPTFLRRLKF